MLCLDAAWGNRFTEIGPTEGSCRP